jgi:hypothetical protein
MHKDQMELLVANFMEISIFWHNKLKESYGGVKVSLRPFLT